MAKLLSLIVVLALIAGAIGCDEQGNQRPNGERPRAVAGAGRPETHPSRSGQHEPGQPPQMQSMQSAGPRKARLRVPGLGPEPKFDPEGCKLVKRVVSFELDVSDYPKTAAHTKDALRHGQPRLLHIDRGGADENRAESLAGIPTKVGFDRDEMAPAMSYEGGKGADVAYVPSADNRGAGASMGAQLTPFCSGQAFRYVFVP